MDFSVIIINYKQRDFILNCIESVRKNLKCKYEIIVVNNSPEDDLSALEGVTIINNSNKGFSHANNFAAKQAKGKYLLFLNADTILTSDFSEAFLSQFKEKEFGAAGLGLKYPDDRLQLSYWYENKFSNEIKNKKLEEAFKKNDTDIIDKYKRDKVLKEVDWVSGASLIIRRDVFESIKGFDEDYFLFYEDADLCKRLTKRGYKTYYFPFDGLIHFKGENVNMSFINDTYYFSKKSQLLYYKKHNNIYNRILLRLYLTLKFSLKVFTERNEINMKILKLIIGVKND